MAIFEDSLTIYDSAYDCFAHEFDMSKQKCEVTSFEGDVIETTVDINKMFPEKSPLSWEGMGILKGLSKNGDVVLMLEKAVEDTIYLAYGWSDSNRRYIPVNGIVSCIKGLALKRAGGTKK